MNQEKLILNWSKALVQLFRDKSEKEKKEMVLRLAGVLKQEKKDYLLPEILKRAAKEIAKVKKVELILSRAQDNSLAGKIKSFLPEVYPKDSALEVKIDESLIGGFRLKTSKYLVRASVKDFLSEIKSKVFSK